MSQQHVMRGAKGILYAARSDQSEVRALFPSQHNMPWLDTWTRGQVCAHSAVAAWVETRASGHTA